MQKKKKEAGEFRKRKAKKSSTHVLAVKRTGVRRDATTIKA